MAILSDNDRAAINQLFQSEASAVREPLPGMTKHDLRNAVNATDQWIEDNKASYAAALPAVVRTNLTARQMARLFFRVANRKWEVA